MRNQSGNSGHHPQMRSAIAQPEAQYTEAVVAPANTANAIHIADTNRNVPEVVAKNIRKLENAERVEERRKSASDRVADAIAGFTGSFGFVLLHVFWFVSWILWNDGLFGLRPFDPYPYPLLMLIVSLEAIFLSAFVLMSQSRMTRRQEERFNLDLQVNLLAEHEITKLLDRVQRVCERLDVAAPDNEIDELVRETDAGEVLDELQSRKSTSAEKRVSESHQ